MTDRIKGLVVVLDREYRTDDVEEIVNAIMMVKGVINVETKVADMNHYMAISKARHDMQKKLLDVLMNVNKDEPA